MSFGFDNTIAAISTPNWIRGISIVRMSGRDSVNILKKIFKPAGNKDVYSLQSHSVNYGHIIDGNKVIDEVIVIIMLSPKSYTKENVVEINCHGGIRVANSVLSCIIKNGADMAMPGEFTKRAFLNGRIDLSQAEAVIDLINSKTELSERASINRLQGRLSKKIKELREKILSMTAHIEAGIDYPEHEDDNITSDIVYSETSCIINSIRSLIETADTGKIIKEGIKTVILGRPNVGKSSLMNFLIDYDKAIVTDIPGTTRDIIEDSVNIGGIPLNIVDTAGIRDTDDIIEKIGVEKSLDYAKLADFILFVADGSQLLTEEDFKILDFIKTHSKKTLVIINKTDLPQKIDFLSFLRYVNKDYIISISVKENINSDTIFSKIKSLFFNGEIDIDQEAVISNERNKASLIKAEKSLINVIETIDNSMPIDLVSGDLLQAYSLLGEIIGESVDEDIIDKIFSEFCLGK